MPIEYKTDYISFPMILNRLTFIATRLEVIDVIVTLIWLIDLFIKHFNDSAKVEPFKENG